MVHISRNNQVRTWGWGWSSLERGGIALYDAHVNSNDIHQRSWFILSDMVTFDIVSMLWYQCSVTLSKYVIFHPLQTATLSCAKQMCNSDNMIKARTQLLSPNLCLLRFTSWLCQRSVTMCCHYALSLCAVTMRCHYVLLPWLLAVRVSMLHHLP